MKSEKTLAAYSEMSKAGYSVNNAIVELEQAQYLYKEELINDTIQDILSTQEEEGKLTARDLKIFLTDLTNKISDVKSR